MKSRWFVPAVLSLFLAAGTVSAQDEAKKEEPKKGRTTLHGLVADGAVCAAKGVAGSAVWLAHQSPKDYAKLAAKGTSEAADGSADAAAFSYKHAKRTPRYASKGLKWLVSRI